MRFAIYGAGAIGAYLGAKLALAGDDVSLIARGPHLRALQERGVRVRYVRRPEELGEPQAVVLPGTKATILDLSGYEIHMGDTEVGPGAGPFAEIVERGQQGVSIADGAGDFPMPEAEYDRLADAVEEAGDWSEVERIVGIA